MKAIFLLFAATLAIFSAERVEQSDIHDELVSVREGLPLQDSFEVKK